MSDAHPAPRSASRPTFSTDAANRFCNFKETMVMSCGVGEGW